MQFQGRQASTSVSRYEVVYRRLQGNRVQMGQDSAGLILGGPRNAQCVTPSMPHSRDAAQVVVHPLLGVIVDTGDKVQNDVQLQGRRCQQGTACTAC